MRKKKTIYEKERLVLGFEKTLHIILLLLVFLIGFLSAYLLMNLDYGYEVPLLKNITGIDGIGFDRAPSDSVNEDLIQVYGDKVVLNIAGISLSRYAPTGSMIPVFDEGANGLRVMVDSVEDINVGDIISFKKDGDLIVHRVIKKEVDNKGVYFITKGDNNNVSDGKIRIDDVEYKTIGVIW